ncbi:MAG: glycosyl transferase [Gammaproteobacteria bacterium]|nr:glycosyl transferase [Gammaproteobacteria bacterium]
MSDFFQNGVITTLHHLRKRSLEEMEQELLDFSRVRPMSLVLPSLYSELQGPALENIIQELCKVPYLSEIVIGLDRADEKQFKHAREYFGQLPQRHRILWQDGPRLMALDQKLKDLGLAPNEMGKGRNVWYCYGYILASERAKSVALHDCDIVTYDRELLARLIYPVANPAFNYQFCKGYYSRTTSGSINGRVCRLLVTPLIRALQQVVGDTPYLTYMDSFRYPLAGEFSFRTDVVRDIRIPSDWGLEIGVLSEVHRNYSANHLCQVDITDNYDHKHQSLSFDNPESGLSKMSLDISKTLFRKLASNGVVLSSDTFRAIKATYYRIALEFIDSYHSDAQFNGLALDRHAEEKAVELFYQNIINAGETFLANPMEKPFIPNWNRVISAIPDFLELLEGAVEADNS